MPSPAAIPVKITVKTLRQMCVEHDPNFYEEGRRPITYEFGGGKRKFREITDQAGPYSGA